MSRTSKFRHATLFPFLMKCTKLSMLLSGGKSGAGSEAW